MSSLLCAASARNSCPSGSPGDTASFLPSRSFGVLMPFEASDTTEKPVELSSDITDLTSAPLAAVAITLERIREAERVGARRHHLHGVGRAAALVDREVDAFLFVEALLLAVIERHVQPADDTS